MARMTHFSITLQNWIIWSTNFFKIWQWINITVWSCPVLLCISLQCLKLIFCHSLSFYSCKHLCLKGKKEISLEICRKRPFAKPIKQYRHFGFFRVRNSQCFAHKTPWFIISSFTKSSVLKLIEILILWVYLA